MEIMELTYDAIDEQLTSQGFIDNPYPIYNALRETHPVYHSDAWGVWVLTRYQDVTTILRDPKRFSSAGRFPKLLDQLPAEVQADVIPLRNHYSGGLIISDPPDHTRLRTL